VTQLTDLDYESIENAVMETTRGRWFLSEHKKRNSQDSTPGLMDAIKRLEKIVVSIGNDITPLNIAEAKPETLNSPSPDNPLLNNAPLNEEDLQFFANDEDLFAGDANAMLTDTDTDTDTDTTTATDTDTEKVSVSFKSVPKNETKPDSERFKVFKMENTTDKISSPPPEKTPEDTNNTPVPVDVPDPVMKATNEEKDRIVVIRNSDKNDIDIPLAADFAQELDSLSAKKF